MRVEYVKNTEDARRLWEMVFIEDSKEYLDFYFSNVTDRNKVLGAYEEDELIGMLHLNPYQVCLNHEDANPEEGTSGLVYYVVAVATHPGYRRKGVMRRLLDEAEKVALEDGAKALVLLPEDERYYRPFGYSFVSEQFNTTVESGLYGEYVGGANAYNVDADTADDHELEYKEFRDWMKKHYTPGWFEPEASDGYLNQLYQEIASEGGRIYMVCGNLVALYDGEYLEVRKHWLRRDADTVGSDADDDGNSSAQDGKTRALEFGRLLGMATWLIGLADGRKLVIHEVNEGKLAGVFPYSKRNVYDRRPYMMVKWLDGDSMSGAGAGCTMMGFDETV